MTKKVYLNQTWRIEDVSEMATYVAWLTDRGYEADIDPTTKKMEGEELMEKLAGVHAFVCADSIITDEMMGRLPDLKIISRIGVGYNTIDIPAATRRGIAVLTTPGAGAEAVSEHSLALMLAVSRRILTCDRSIRRGEWKRFIGPGLFRKTLGIIGMGHIGKKLAEIVKGFDMKVVVYDMARDVAFARANAITYVETLGELLAESDYVAIHAPYNEKTANMIDMAAMKKMKPTAILINSSRGGIINEADLCEALKDGVILGAGLDVFEREPFDMASRLLELDNVVLTGHNAGSSTEGKNKVVAQSIENVIAWDDGKIPPGTINPEAR